MDHGILWVCPQGETPELVGLLPAEGQIKSLFRNSCPYLRSSQENSQHVMNTPLHMLMGLFTGVTIVRITSS